MKHSKAKLVMKLDNGIYSGFQDMCFDCGKGRYPEERKDGLNGIGVAFKKCDICGEEKGIIPARDWAYRAGEFIKWL